MKTIQYTLGIALLFSVLFAGHQGNAAVNTCFVPMPQLSVNPTAMDFGTVQHGSSKTMTLTVQLYQVCALNDAGTNCGCHYPSSLELRVEMLSGTQFTVLGAATRSISGSTPIDIDVRFNAPLNQEDLYEGELRVYIVKSSMPGTNVIWTSAADRRVSLSGISHIPRPNMLISPTSLDLGATDINTSKTGSIYIGNDGDLNLTTSFSTSAPYSVSPTSATVIPNGEKEVQVMFQPAMRGPFDQIVTIQSNDPNAAVVQYVVSGKGLAPRVSVTPLSYDYGSVPVGDAKSIDVTITNSDDPYSSDLELTNFADNSSSYSFTGPVQTTLAPGAATTLTVTFRPVSFGTKNALLSFTTNDPDNPNVAINLTGFGESPAINPSTLNLDWGAQHLGTTATRSLTIRNDGSQTLNVSGFTTPDNTITVSPTFASIAAGDSAVFAVRYKPTVVSTLNGELVIHSNDPALPDLGVQCSGEGVTPDIDTVGLLDFQSVYIDPADLTNADERDLDVTVRNQGNEILNITGITSTNAAFTPLVTVLTVPIGGEAVLPVRYRPTRLGEESGFLQIASNDYFTPLQAISLRGTGVSALDLSVSHLEVTQAIQNGSSNGIHLVAGRLATVRAKIDVDLFGGNTANGAVRQVDGLLHVFKNGTEVAGSPFRSQNGPITAPTNPDRSVTDQTLNFLVPRSLTQCANCANPLEVTFEMEVNPLSGSRAVQVAENDFTNNRVTETAFFNPRYQPEIVAIPISYGRAIGSCRGLPDNEMVLDGPEFLRAIYPLPDIDYQIGSPLTFNCDINSTLSNCDGMRADYRLHELLFIAGHLGGLNPDLIYGWFRCNAFGGNGQALLNGKTGFGNTSPLRYQRTFAHEVGHNLGSEHPVPPLYLEEVGYDSLQQEVRYRPGIPFASSETRADVMVGGLLTEQAWITPLMYELFYAQLDPDSPFSGDFPNSLILNPDQDVWLLSGDAAADGTAHIGPIYKTNGSWGEPRGDANSPYSLQLLDRDGLLLKEYGLQVGAAMATELESPLSVPFSIILPVVEEAVTIRLLKGQDVLAERERSLSAPALSIMMPVGGELIGDTLEVIWQASDADGDDLLYSVQYQPDGTAPWTTLGVNLTERDFTYPSVLLAGGDAARVRVIATDGFDTTQADSNTFRVPTKPPLVRILSPQDGSSFLNEATIILRAEAIDPEEGTLTDDKISWSSDIVGWLGNGSEVAVSLPTGSHILTAQATDSDGLSASEQVAILVSNGAQAPRASAGADQEVSEGETVILDASASEDPDSQILSYAWMQLSGPVVTLNEPATPNPYFIAPAVDADALLRFQVVVTDETGQLSSDTVDIAVINRDFAQLEVGAAELDFGIVDVGQVGELALQLRNTGNEALVVTGLETSRAVFQVSPQELVLAPQEAGTVMVLFSPDEFASYEALLHVLSNSIEGVSNTVVLRGATPLVLEQYQDTGPGGSLILADIIDPNGPQPDQGGTNQLPSGSSPVEGTPDAGTPTPGAGGTAAGCSLIRR